VRFVIKYVYMAVDDVDVDKGPEDKSPDKFDGALSRVYGAKSARREWGDAESQRKRTVAQAALNNQPSPAEIRDPVPMSPDALLGEEIIKRENSIVDLFRRTKRFIITPPYDSDEKKEFSVVKKNLDTRLGEIKSGVGNGVEGNEPVLVAEALAFTRQAFEGFDQNDPYFNTAIDLIHNAPFLLRDPDLSRTGCRRITDAAGKDPFLKSGKNREVLRLLQESGKMRPDEARQLQEIVSMIAGSDFVNKLPDSDLGITVVAESLANASGLERSVIEESLKEREAGIDNKFDAVLAAAGLLNGQRGIVANSELMVLGMVREAADRLGVKQYGEPGVEDMIANRRKLAEALQAVIPGDKSVLEYRDENPQTGFASELNRFLRPGATTHSQAISNELSSIHQRVYHERSEKEKRARELEAANKAAIKEQLAAETSAQEQPVEPAVSEVPPAPDATAAPEGAQKSGGSGIGGFLRRFRS